MNAYVLLLAELSGSVVISLGALYVLSRPLVNMLSRICPDEQAAVFWWNYTKVLLIIAPLLLVLTVQMCSSFDNPIDKLRLILMAELAGLLLSLCLIGRRLGHFVVLPK